MVGLFSEQHRLNSPKRPSLDERLEKELGIKVRDNELNGIPDFSKPPPGTDDLESLSLKNDGNWTHFFRLPNHSTANEPK